MHTVTAESVPALTLGHKLGRWAAASLVFSAVPMLVAGQFTSVYLWIFAAGCSLIALYAVNTVSPDLARERYSPPTSGQDGIWLRWFRLISFATVVFALFDSGRWQWSPPMSSLWRFVGLTTFLAGLFLFVYAMSVNRFFSTVIRIQTDRGHHVVDRGPYAIVRHPGYVGMMAVVATLPLTFGSWWAFVPASALIAFGLRRVWAEDHFLQDNLPGYREYAERVRYRLIPGVW
jgi:protein-S-isoprenylcysteine O-methyltransferase Ste14